MLLLLVAYAPAKFAPFAKNKKWKKVFDENMARAEEDDLRLSIILADKLAEVVAANRALLQTNEAILNSYKETVAKEKFAEIQNVPPPKTEEEIQRGKEFAEKMKAAKEAKQAQLDAEKKEFLKRMKRGKAKAARRKKND